MAAKTLTVNELINIVKWPFSCQVLNCKEKGERKIRTVHLLRSSNLGFFWVASITIDDILGVWVQSCPIVSDTASCLSQRPLSCRLVSGGENSVPYVSVMALCSLACPAAARVKFGDGSSLLQNEPFSVSCPSLVSFQGLLWIFVLNIFSQILELPSLILCTKYLGYSNFFEWYFCITIFCMYTKYRHLQNNTTESILTLFEEPYFFL